MAKQAGKAGITQVPDRSAIPLGREAQVAALLRGYGADPALVPPHRLMRNAGNGSKRVRVS